MSDPMITLLRHPIEEALIFQVRPRSILDVSKRIHVYWYTVKQLNH